MYRSIVLSLLLLICGEALAYETPVEIIEYIDDVKVIAYLNKSEIAKSPQWIPFESPPPLSIQDALQAVRLYLESDADFTDARLVSIELKRIPHYEQHWHYLAKVRYRVGDKIEPHFFAILMDGKLVSAIKEPESIK